jgi:hypothetical protein
MEEEQAKMIHEMKEYKCRLLEKNAIHNDMKPKLDRIRILNQEMHHIESKIIQYMHDKGHEAIRFENCVFKIKKKNKTRPTTKKLKQNMKEILDKSSNIDPLLYSQLTDIFNNKKIDSEKESIDCILPNTSKKTQL